MTVEDEVGPGRYGARNLWQDQPLFSAAFEDTASRLGSQWKEGETEDPSRNLVTTRLVLTPGCSSLPENPILRVSLGKPGGHPDSDHLQQLNSL